MKLCTRRRVGIPEQTRHASMLCNLRYKPECRRIYALSGCSPHCRQRGSHTASLQRPPGNEGYHTCSASIKWLFETQTLLSSRPSSTSTIQTNTYLDLHQDEVQHRADYGSNVRYSIECSSRCACRGRFPDEAGWTIRPNLLPHLQCQCPRWSVLPV